jgi:hypothetical protein
MELEPCETALVLSGVNRKRAVSISEIYIVERPVVEAARVDFKELHG